jgi:hypothetical protein
MQKGDNPLGNQVTFDLIDIGRLMCAQVAETMVHGVRMLRASARG